MRYIGSKLSLLDFLYEKITEVAGKDNNKIFADLFAGSGAVSLKKFLKNMENTHILKRNIEDIKQTKMKHEITKQM